MDHGFDGMEGRNVVSRISKDERLERICSCVVEKEPKNHRRIILATPTRAVRTCRVEKGGELEAVAEKKKKSQKSHQPTHDFYFFFQSLPLAHA